MFSYRKCEKKLKKAYVDVDQIANQLAEKIVEDAIEMEEMNYDDSEKDLFVDDLIEKMSNFIDDEMYSLKDKLYTKIDENLIRQKL